MEFVKAYTPDNAVKAMAIAIEFENVLLHNELEALLKALEEDKYLNSEFSEKQHQQEISVIITPDGGQSHTQSIGGLVCIKKVDNNVTWALTINKQHITATCKSYTRWEEVSEKAFEQITYILNLINNNNKIRQSTLEYLDEFIILNSEKNWKQELFSKEATYLISNIFNLADYWHINHGYFIQLEDLNDKILDTININYFADENDNLKNKINIRTQHKLIYLTPKKYNKESFKEEFQIIHDHSKKIFNQLISDEILLTFNQGKL